MGEVRRYRRWTQDAIIAEFHAFRDEHGRPPKWEDLGKGSMPWPSTVERLFGGSFDQAMLAAGFIPRGVGQPRKHHGVRIAS